ncbi:MAG: hypothetical protein AB1689_10255 [Thermodesulfobacteriota bacterium]
MNVAGRAVVRLAAALALASVVTGCAKATTLKAYPGPELPPDEEAQLRVINYRAGASVWNAIVVSVNGTEAPFLFRDATDRNFLFSAPTSRERVLFFEPGPQTLQVAFFWDEFGGGAKPDDNGTCTITFQAKPGRDYELASEYWRDSTLEWFLEERRWRAWVVDTASQQTVSSPECVPTAG